MFYDCKDTKFPYTKHQIAKVAMNIKSHDQHMVATLQCHNTTPKLRLCRMHCVSIITTSK